MNNSVLESVKKSKFFKPFDIVIYSLVLVIILCFFLIFVVFKSDNNVLGFKVNIDNQDVIYFEYEKGIDGFTFEHNYSTLTQTKKIENSIEVKIFTNEQKTAFNLLQIDLENKCVKMLDSNCKNKDCTHFKGISSDSGSIICVPHNLIVSAITEKPNKDIVIG